MIKRYFSHYAIIYPMFFLKNHIIELDNEDHLIRYYPFEKELRNTQFYSGLLIFTPSQLSLDFSLINEYWSKKDINELMLLFQISNNTKLDQMNRDKLIIHHIP